MEKHYVYVSGDGSGADSRPLGIRYDARPKKNMLMVAGWEKDRVDMEDIASRYFKLDFVNMVPKWHQKNKIKFEVKMSRKEYLAGMQSMRDSGVLVVETSTLCAVVS